MRTLRGRFHLIEEKRRVDWRSRVETLTVLVFFAPAEYSSKDKWKVADFTYN